MFLSLTAVLLLAACGAATPAPATTGEAATATLPPRPTVLRVAFDSPVKLDPGFASSDSEIAVLNAIYDYLVDIDSNSQVMPRLASKWDVSADGLTYTFTLVPNVKFHDGTPLTAKDVAWTFDRLRNPNLQLPTLSLYTNIESIKTNGDSQVIFRLYKTNPFFLYDLSDNHALILKENTADPAKAIIGSGPFKLGNYSPENRMELVANDKYFIPGKPGVAGLTFIFFKDQAASVNALRGGQVDLVMRMPSAMFKQLQSEKSLTAVSIPTNGFDLVRLRADRKPGNDPRVVQAFKLATNRKAIFDNVALGYGAVGRDSPIGPLFKAYYSEETVVPARDPKAAKALLAQAGYPDGLKMDLHVPDSGDRPDLAVVLKEQWKEAGIDVNVVTEPESVYYADNGWLQVDLGITGWGSRPSPQFYFDVMLVSGAKWNESHWKDKEVDQLAATAGSTLDEAARIKAYKDLQRVLIERGPLIVPYFFAQFGAISNNFTNFTLKAFAGRTDLAAIRAK
jgi:peptide/nickel transport system substrate-binding protein